MVARVGYVGTFGKDLFQTIDGNPRLAEQHARVSIRHGASSGCAPTRPNPGTTRCRPASRSGSAAGLAPACITPGANTSIPRPRSSIRRRGEVAVAQDSYDREADKGRSSYDRPHRLTGNFVWELPWMRDQQGVAGQDPRRLAGGVLLHLPERRAVHRAQRRRSDRRAGRHRRARRQRHQAEPEHESGPVEDDDPGDHRGRGREPLQPSLRGRRAAPLRPAERVGNVPRNSLRADGIGNIDFSLTKNTRFLNGHNMQFRVELFNATNTRNFGIPEGRVNATQLPEPVGHRWRQSAHLAGRPVHLLANDYDVQGPGLRPLDLPARIISSS